MTRSPTVAASIVAGTCIFGFLHFLYSGQVGIVLYRAAGGIRTAGAWTEYGGAPFAWAIPLELPGTFLLHVGAEALGALLVPSASVVAGYSFAALLVDRLARHRWVCGRYYWRVVVLVLALTWVPVRENYAWVFYHTVRF
jgi:hypothetical protein